MASPPAAVKPLCHFPPKKSVNVSTIALAIITFFYLMATRNYVTEARKQRELMQAQFVSANSPNIIIESPQDFVHRTENIMFAEIKIHNTGTPVENADVLFALLCCEKIEGILRRYSDVTYLQNAGHFPRIGQNHKWAV